MTEQPVTQIHAGQQVKPRLPLFEGRAVDQSTVAIRGATPMDELDDVVISVDDRVRLVAEYKVVGVRHYVNTDGDLVREQVLKPLRAQLTPWDPSDPDDDGVIRAL